MNKLIYQGDWSVPVRKDFILSPDYSIGEKALYIALRSFCSPDQSAFPSSSLLAKGLGVGRDTIYKYAASLEEKGLISREQSRSDEPGESGKFSHTIYTLYDTTSPKLSSPHPKEPLSEKPQTEKTVTVKTDTNQYPYKEESISITNKGEVVLLQTESDTHAESQAGGTPVSPPHVPPSPSPVDALFEKFWAAYPRKVSKGDARKAFPRALKKVSDVSVILKALEIHKRLPGWVKDDGQFIPYPASWLNDERWSDEVKKDRGHNLWSKVDPKSKQW